MKNTKYHTVGQISIKHPIVQLINRHVGHNHVLCLLQHL